MVCRFAQCEVNVGGNLYGGNHVQAISRCITLNCLVFLTIAGARKTNFDEAPPPKLALTPVSDNDLAGYPNVCIPLAQP